MKKTPLSVNLDSVQLEEYRRASARMDMSLSNFIRITAAIGYDALKENPERLFTVLK